MQDDSPDKAPAGVTLTVGEHEQNGKPPTRTMGKYALNGRSLSLGDRLRLQTLHSSGGIGEVWLAHDDLLNRDVALKRLKPDQAKSKNHRDRFFREARITGQLDHPGIVPVYDYSASEGGDFFYTMRFVRGRTLRQVTRGFHRERADSDFPYVGGDLLELLNHFSSVCHTMAFAHSKGVIHRDIKGDNIIVGDFGEVILLDWGLAKELGIEVAESIENGGTADEATKTQYGQQLGTPAYMAPEQALGQLDKLDHRTDIYGLCAVLYEILTGQPPFIDDDVQTVLKRVVQEPPKPPRELIPEIPFDLEQTCLRGLSKDPAERHRSVSELEGEVRTWLGRLAERTRAEQEREHFFGISDDFLAIVNHDGRIEQSNPAWEQCLSLDAVDRLGRAFTDFIDPDDRGRIADYFDVARQTGESLTFEARIMCVGKTVWAHWNLRSLPETGQFYLVGRDISELKHSEQRFRSFVENAPDATCVVDSQGSILVVNGALERMFGFEREELIGQTIEYLVPSAARERHRQHVKHFVERPVHRPMGSGLNLMGQGRDGETFPVEISLGPVESGGELLMACAIRRADDRRAPDRLALAVLDGAPDPVLALDSRGQIEHSNRAAAEFLGVDRSVLRGAGLRDYLSAQGGRQLRDAIDQAMESHEPAWLQLIFLPSPGKRARAHLRRIDGESGPLVCLTLRAD